VNIIVIIIIVVIFLSIKLGFSIRVSS